MCDIAHPPAPCARAKKEKKNLHDGFVSAVLRSMLVPLWAISPAAGPESTICPCVRLVQFKVFSCSSCLLIREECSKRVLLPGDFWAGGFFVGVGLRILLQSVVRGSLPLPLSIKMPSNQHSKVFEARTVGQWCCQVFCHGEGGLSPLT